MTVVQPEEARQTVVEFIKGHSQMIAESLPQHLSSERFVRLALTSMRKTPKLQECSPQSFIGALLTASALGLEPDVSGECYLVPYKDRVRGMETQLIIGYQGVAKLFWQHPLAQHLEAEAVYANDVFDWQKGTNSFLRFRPASGERGDLIAYYALAGLANGATEFVVLSPKEVAVLRGGKVGPKGDIADPQRWMERKTALKQLLKLLPKSVLLTQALRVDEQVGSSLAAAGAAKAITKGEVMADLPPTPAEPDGPMIPPQGEQ